MDLETTLFAEFIDFQEVYSIFQDFLLVENATKKFHDFPVPLIRKQLIKEDCCFHNSAVYRFLCIINCNEDLTQALKT